MVRTGAASNLARQCDLQRIGLTPKVGGRSSRSNHALTCVVTLSQPARSGGVRREVSISQKDLPYPANRGFASSRRGTVQPGSIIDRYGKPTGRFAGNPGDSVSQKGLPAGSGTLDYHRYEVLKPIPAEIGPASPVPEFGAEGGGIQYLFKKSIKDLVNEGYLRELT